MGCGELAEHELSDRVGKINNRASPCLRLSRNGEWVPAPEEAAAAEREAHGRPLLTGWRTGLFLVQKGDKTAAGGL